MAGYARGSGRAPKFIFGRKNIFYREPERAVKSSDQDINALNDFMVIAQDYLEATDLAAASLSRGDMEKYNVAVHRAAQILDCHEKWISMVETMPESRIKMRKWAKDYEKFRSEMGLNNEFDKRVVVDPRSLRYVSAEYGDEEVKHVMSAVSESLDEAGNILNSKPDGSSYPYDELSNAHTSNQEKYNYQIKQSPDNKDDSKSNGDEDSESSDSKSSHYDPNEVPWKDRAKNKENGGDSPTEEFKAIPETKDTKEKYKGFSKNRKNNERKSDDGGSNKKTENYSKKPLIGLKPSPNGSRLGDAIENAFKKVERSAGVDEKGSLRVTKRKRVGPFRLNFGRRGLSSVSLRLGFISWSVWSKDYEPGVSSYDLPSGLSYRQKRKRRVPTVKEPA